MIDSQRGLTLTAPTRRSFPVACIVLLAAFGLALGAQTASAAALKSCALRPAEQDPPGSRPTYNLGLKQQGTTCVTAKKVMKAYHACRPAKGYTCRKRVLVHWTCTARKTSSTPLMFYATYSCRWGSRRVTGSYQQNT